MESKRDTGVVDAIFSLLCKMIYSDLWFVIRDIMLASCLAPTVIHAKTGP